MHLFCLSVFSLRDIFNNIGEFASMNREFANCYLDCDGRDIENGKLTWLIVVALQRARRDQVKVLEECYGQQDAEKAKKVKEVRTAYTNEYTFSTFLSKSVFSLEIFSQKATLWQITQFNCVVHFFSKFPYWNPHREK